MHVYKSCIYFIGRQHKTAVAIAELFMSITDVNIVPSICSRQIKYEGRTKIIDSGS